MAYRIPGWDVVASSKVVFEGRVADDPFRDEGLTRIRVELDLAKQGAPPDDRLVVHDCQFEGRGGVYVGSELIEYVLQHLTLQLARHSDPVFRGRLVLQMDTLPLQV